MMLPSPDLYVPLPDGRRIALDDRGDRSGTPVLYLHGTPDSRLARHPDDSIAERAGVRLLAPDRPGIGHSDPDLAATPASVADDLVAVLDHVGAATARLLAWSAGSLFALALAGRHPGRVAGVTFVGPLVPAQAYDDPAVVDGADDGRRLFADAHRGMSPDEVAEELAPWLVPPVIDEPTARELLSTSIRDVDHIPGAAAQLVAGLCASVRGGLGGVERDIAAQATPIDLGAVDAPTQIHVGEDDTTCPPAMARWLADALDAPLMVHAGAGHALAITSWATLLA